MDLTSVSSECSISVEEEQEVIGRKRLRPTIPLVDADGDANEARLPPACEHKKKAHRASSKYKLQSPFQPGATPQEGGKRRFLCYNMLGCITTIELEGRSLIEVDFHDTEKGPPMIDTYGFTMGSISENGCVFASPCKGEKNISVVMYRPFKNWASNSGWTARFDKGEEVKVVANGSGWVAAVTSLNFLRIYSEGGLHKHILCLDGPVVTAVGCKDQLAVVFHVSDYLPSNEQEMKFRVFNISRMTEQSKGCVPLTPGSRLTWIGFSEDGALSSYDSEGVLRVFDKSQFGGSWIPLFSSSKKKKPEENYCVVGLDETTFYCIACEHYPQVIPTPIQTALDFSSCPNLQSQRMREEMVSSSNVMGFGSTLVTGSE